MTDFQAEKQLVRDHYAALDAAPAAALADAAAQRLAAGSVMHAVHPWDELTGPESQAERLWRPMRAAFPHLQRRPDIFFAGHSAAGERPGTWVACGGHLMGLFDAPFLGIPPTGRMAFLRFAFFHRVEDGRITEEAMFLDIPALMMQAGLQPFPPQTGAHLIQPGPVTHDGLQWSAQDPEEGAATLALIERMITDLGQWRGALPLEEELARTWHPDMIWWGPAGIGATCTIPRYARQHSGPFRAAFADRSPTRHLARLAEGAFGGFFGWPNFTAVHRGGFMGMPSGSAPGEFRVVDFYRRGGDLLAENWVHIDLLHFWKTQGVDILARTTQLATV